MCGLSGFLHKHICDESILRQMNDSIQYRGPDDSGVELTRVDENWQLGLGHRRLSIIDLSPLGHQPMFSDSKDIVIVFNGEIYNFLEIRGDLIKSGFTFKSHSDTEVIIKSYQKWGVHCINKFNGMFAIALFDYNTKELFLIRDRLGIKPMYYYYDGENIAFSSELKPIMRYPNFKKRINLDALNIFLCHGYIASPQTIFQQTFKLEPGTYLRFKEGQISVQHYWSIKDKFLNRHIVTASEDEVLEQLHELLMSSVKYRMISDVPLGAFLSGGNDSSTIVALMQQVSHTQVKTFTIGFAEEAYNEAVYAKKVAEHLGTDHHELYLPIGDTKRLLYDLPTFFDEPFADSSQLPSMLVSKLARTKVTVCLSGDGGDELFCGYSSYDLVKEYKKYQGISRLLHNLNRTLPVETLLSKIDRKLIKLCSLNSDENIINYLYLSSKIFIDKLVFNSDFIINGRYYDLLELTDNIQEKNMLQDLNIYLPDDILTKVDRATMAYSLEGRIPFLDYRLVEYSFSIPHQLKYNHGVKKYILKKLLHTYVPQELLDRPKKGFSVPIYQWLHEDLHYLLDDYCNEAFIKHQNIFSYAKISQIKKHFNQKDSYFDRLLWHILVFQMWWERYCNSH